MANISIVPVDVFSFGERLDLRFKATNGNEWQLSGFSTFSTVMGLEQMQYLSVSNAKWRDWVWRLFSSLKKHLGFCKGDVVVRVMCEW